MITVHHVNRACCAVFKMRVMKAVSFEMSEIFKVVMYVCFEVYGVYLFSVQMFGDVLDRLCEVWSSGRRGPVGHLRFSSDIHVAF